MGKLSVEQTGVSYVQSVQAISMDSYFFLNSELRITNSTNAFCSSVISWFPSV